MSPGCARSASSVHRGLCAESLHRTRRGFGTVTACPDSNGWAGSSCCRSRSYAVITLLVFTPSWVRGPKYRPGLSWWAEPVWIGGSGLDAAREAQAVHRGWWMQCPLVRHSLPVKSQCDRACDRSGARRKRPQLLGVRRCSRRGTSRPGSTAAGSSRRRRRPRSGRRGRPGATSTRDPDRSNRRAIPGRPGHGAWSNVDDLFLHGWRPSRWHRGGPAHPQRARSPPAHPALGASDTDV